MVNNKICTIKKIRVSTYATQDDVLKIKGKHFVFKASIAAMKTRLLIDNGSKTKLIDKSFVYTQKLSSFKLKKNKTNTRK